jgi:hypothetical protein
VNTITNLRETIIEDNIPFNVVIPVVEQSLGPDNPEKKIRIEGLARTTTVSLNHLLTTENFIASMKRQVKEANPKIPSFLDHDPNKVIGNIMDVKDSKDSEFWPITELIDKSGNPVVDAPVEQVIHWLKQNVRLGMSISGHATESKWVEDMDTGEWWIEANDGILLENSITPIPAQLETSGKIKVKDTCEYGFCNQLGEQIQEHLIKSNNPISEVLKEKLEQRKENKPKLEDKTMDEETKTLIENQNKKIDGILEYINKDIEAKEKATKEAQEKQAREELKEELKEEVAKEFKEEVAPAIAGAIKEQLDGFKQELFGDRNHIQQSATITKEGQKPDGNLQAPLIINQEAKDPQRSIAENHKSVIMGETVVGKTPSEMFA